MAYLHRERGSQTTRRSEDFGRPREQHYPARLMREYPRHCKRKAELQPRLRTSPWAHRSRTCEKITYDASNLMPGSYLARFGTCVTIITISKNVSSGALLWSETGSIMIRRRVSHFFRGLSDGTCVVSLRHGPSLETPTSLLHITRR